MPNDQHMPTVKVAEVLGVDVRTVHRWVAAGSITPTVKAPGLRGPYIFDRDEVERVKRIKAEGTAA